jgi:uncharacterized repeat protein (TIGR01451 family)
MRRIAWVFALFGATGLVGRTGPAAEPTTAPRAGLAASSTKTKSTPTPRPLKNYSAELFGEEEATASVKPKTAKPVLAHADESEAAGVVKPKAAKPTGPAEPEAAAVVKKTQAPKPSDEWAKIEDPATEAASPFAAPKIAGGLAEQSDNPFDPTIKTKTKLKPAAGSPTATGSQIQPASGPKLDAADLELDELDVEELHSVQQVGAESPWAKTRTTIAPASQPAVKPLPAAKEQPAPKAPAAPETDAFKFAPATREQPTAAPSFAPKASNNKLTTPIDTSAADPAEQSELPAVAAPKSSLTITRPPVTDRPRNPIGQPASQTTASKFAPTAPPVMPRNTPPAATFTRAAPLVAVAAPVTETTGQSPNVTVTWRSSGSINIGQECTCELVVKNSGTAAAQDLEVEATFPKNVRLLSAEPKPAHATGHLGWKLDNLAAGEERIIAVKLIPTQRGQIDADARVRFSGAAKQSFTVAEPLLSLKVEAPKQVMVGDPAPHMVLVTNPGTGVATNVKIEAIIPKGLEHAKGERLVMDLGSLNPGETRNVRLACAAVSGGNHKLQVRAIADADLNEAASSDVQVVAPMLAAAVEGPALRYLGRQAVFSLSVVNEGSASTDNVRVMHKIPDGFDFVSAERGATFDAGNRLLSWYVGHLEQGQKTNLAVTLLATKAGEFTHFVRATSEAGAINDAQTTTRVEGTPSLALNIKDLADPVEVGVETGYEVTIKNEGSAPATNVGLALEVPSSVKVLAATGPSKHSVDKDQVVFSPIGSIAPGQSVTFTLKVLGQVSGNARLRTSLTSDSTAEPLTAEELTKFYQ